MKRKLKRYNSPIFIRDRDWEVAKELISTELGITNDKQIESIMRDFKSKSSMFDAECFIIYLKQVSAERFARILSTDKCINIIRERTGIESDEEAFNVLLQAEKLTLNGEGYKIRDLYLKSTKEYKECKTDKEKDDYVKKYY